MNNDNKYFAAKEPKKTAQILLNRANSWFNNLENNGYLEKVKQCWAAYHGAYYSGIENSHRISFGGEQGELAQIAVNHLRNIARNMLVMITATRPSLQARATNSDYKSLVQTKLANGLLDYYLREKRLETYLKTACEYAIVLGSGYIKMEWNATSGNIYDYSEAEFDPETGEPTKEALPIYEGDVSFENLSPFDVVFDDNVETVSDNIWVLCRTFKNKYDIIAKYPEYKDKIEALPTKTDLNTINISQTAFGETELIPIYEFYHKRTESIPEGRYLMFLDDNVVLVDTAMPYRNLPIYRMSASDILGTPYGYSPLFDLLPVQEAVNSLYSSILTNQSTFAVQNIFVKRGSDVSFESISGGLNIIEANEKPEPLQLTSTPPEVFNFLQMLVKDMEVISGVNSVARGNPESSLKSGTALALVQSMALQFMSGLQQSYVQLIEDVGTGMITMLRDFASVPRVAMIAGKNNRSYMKEFNGEDLSNVNRVIVDIGNPLSKCLAKDTPVLMYDGSIQLVQDIKIGELIMGPDSKPRTVNNVNTGFENMYQITSKNKKRKVSYGCNESHILTLKYCSDDNRYNAKKGDIIDITVRDFLKLPKRQKRLLQGFKTGVDFSKKDTIIPAYILGTWLGDGNSANTGITTMDQEIVNEWANYAQSIGMNFRTSTSTTSGKAKTYYITSGQANGKNNRNLFLNELKSMEVIYNKHIPELYLKTSRKDRLELLAGLIDTDGSLVNETFIFTQKSNKLSDNVVFLSESLGFRTVHSKFEVSGNEYNKITIGGNTWEIPTKLPRKQVKRTEKYRDWLNYGIEIEAKGFGQYYGFTLAEEPHFVLGDFTVTHNTTAGKVQMAEQMLQMGLIKRPEEYFMVMETGKLDDMTDDIVREELSIKAENEKLVDNEPVIAVYTDNHLSHILEHKNILSDPELRFDKELVERVYGHINEHVNLLRTVDPALLTLMGQQPLGPAAGSPPAPQQGQNVPDASMQGAIPEQMQQTTANTVDAQQTSGVAGMPSIPKVEGSLLPNPELQAQTTGNVE